MLNKMSGQRRQRGLIRRVLAGLVFVAVGFAFLSFPATPAHALDKDQLVQMTKLGLETESIKGAIDRADDDFKLSKGEIEELRKKGVSEEIIDYLHDKGHVMGGDGDKAADQKQADKSGNKDGTAGPAPAPGTADEDKAEDLSEEELEKRVQQKAEKLNEKRAQEKKRKRKLKQLARKLPEIRQLVEDEQNMEAARRYLKFLSYKPEKNSKNWYEAKFWLAKALYQQGILSGASKPLRDVLMAGADRPHFEEAFSMLEDLTAKIGFQPPALEQLTQFYIGDKSQEFKNNFNYYLGKFFHDYQRRDVAIKYLTRVEEGAADYPEARYLLGVSQLDPKVDKKPEALRNFERAIVAGEAEPGGNQEILELGYMALARVFYEVGLYDVALYYYQKIPPDSARSAEALFERAWTYFMKNDFKRALGAFHTLDSPYYEDWYFPDLYILEATVYLNLCRFDKSKQALARFQDNYLDKRPALKRFMKQVQAPKIYWEAVTSPESLEGKDTPTLPDLFADAVLDDLEFYRLYKTVQVLRKEKAQLEANIDNLGDFGETVLARVQQQLQNKIKEGGILVRKRLNEVDEELERWDLAATQISFDIDSEEKEQLERQYKSKHKLDRETKPGSTLLIVAADWMPWPFEGEYWLDEVKNYRSRLRSQCVESE